MASTASTAASALRQERGVGRQRTDEREPGAAQPRERGLDHLDFLAAEMAAFAGMRVQAAHQDARPAHREEAPQVGVQDAQHGLEPLRRDGGGHVLQREVRRGERHAQAAADQHHDRQRGAAACGEILGVAGERHARVVDDALVHRRGHHRVELAREATVDRPVEQRRARIGHSRDPGARRGTVRAERHVQHLDAVAWRGRHGS